MCQGLSYALYIWLLNFSEAQVFNLCNGDNGFYFQSYENRANVGKGSTVAPIKS